MRLTLLVALLSAVGLIFNLLGLRQASTSVFAGYLFLSILSWVAAFCIATEEN